MITINIWVFLISIALTIIFNVVLVWDLYKEKSKLKKLQNRVYKKAAQVLEEGKKNLQSLARNNTKILEDESKSLRNHYKEMVREVDDEYRKKASYAVSLLEKATEGEVKDFGKDIDQEIASQINRSKQEIEEYKKEKLAHVDEAVVNIIKQASEEILGKTISLRDHQALIIEALEKAKKEHFI